MRYFFISILLCSYCSGLMAQSSIFDTLARTGQGKGVVSISQPAAVKKLVDTRSGIEDKNGITSLKSNGYRIQVFSGNNQKTSKGEAFTRERQIKSLFANASTSVTYNAPFWRVQVGNYTTYEEVYGMYRQLIAAFPSFSKELNIIKEEVTVPLN